MAWLGVDVSTVEPRTPPRKSPKTRSKSSTRSQKQKQRLREANSLFRPHLPNAEELAVIKRKLTAAAYSVGGVDWEHLFNFYDADNSGGLNIVQFTKCIRKDAKMTEIMLSKESVQMLFNSIDTDHDDAIELDEFLAWLGVAPRGRSAAASPRTPARTKSSRSRPSSTKKTRSSAKNKNKAKSGGRLDITIPATNSGATSPAPASPGYRLSSTNEDLNDEGSPDQLSL
jgi:Ca2+-binding EF-hand superfamily protein